MYNSVIFDLDGTLLDTVTDLASATNQVLIKNGYTERPEENYNHYLGGGVYNLLRRALKDQPEDTSVSDKEIEQLLPELVAQQKSLYAELWAISTKPYPQIESMLRELKSKGARLAVVSNKPHVFTVEMVHHFFGKDMFDAILGQKNERPAKPEPDMLYHVMKNLKLDKKQVLYVGDTDTDMQTALNADVASVGVSWGFRSIQELQENKANYIVHSAMEIVEVYGG